jgi:hypothetical protein
VHQAAVIPQAALAAVIPQATLAAVTHRVSRRAVTPPATQALPAVRQVDARSPVGLAFSVAAVPLNLKAGLETTNGSAVIGVDCSVSFGIDQLGLMTHRNL